MALVGSLVIRLFSKMPETMYSTSVTTCLVRPEDCTEPWKGQMQNTLTSKMRTLRRHFSLLNTYTSKDAVSAMEHSRRSLLSNCSPASISARITTCPLGNAGFCHRTWILSCLDLKCDPIFQDSLRLPDLSDWFMLCCIYHRRQHWHCLWRDQNRQSCGLLHSS